MRYNFIQEYQGRFQNSVMFRMLGVSSSAFHRWKKRPESQREQQKQQLVTHICELFEESEGRYGSPRIHRDLKAVGIKCSPKRVAQLMKEQRLVARKPRKFVVTTDSNHAFPIAKNTLDRKYQVENQVSGRECGRAGPSLGWRHYLCANSSRLVVSGGRARPQKPQGYWLEHEGLPRAGAGA
jgi:transposase InsO family protein